MGWGFPLRGCGEHRWAGCLREQPLEVCLLPPWGSPLLLLLFSGASVSRSSTRAPRGRLRVWGSWWAGTISTESPPVDCSVQTVREQRASRDGAQAWTHGGVRVWGEDCGQCVCVTLPLPDSQFSLPLNTERVWGWTECIWGPSGLGQAPSNSESVQGEATSTR